MKTGLCLLLLLLPLVVDGKSVRRARRDAEESHSPIKVERDNFVLREDQRLMISCVYSADDLDGMAHLKWLTSSGKPIDGESSSSVFTIALHEHSTGFMKKTLHFTEIKKRDSGDYICQATNVDGSVFNRTVNVNVLDKMEWLSNETRVGGLVGEPLTIDCGAKAEPEPTIQITDEDGEPLNDDLFTIAGSEISIKSLTKDYNGLIVNCVALQILPDLDTTSTEQRSVTIDVWFTPEFESDRIDRYTILHRDAIIPCNVTESNPPARHFNFFRKDILLKDESKYKQVMDVMENAAYLKVLDVDESDLGEYSCEVNNGRAKATQIINLKEANPPDEVKVTLESVKKHGIVWMIETNEKEDELKATKIEIQYIRQEVMDKELEKGDETEEEVWHAKSRKTIRNIVDSQIYDIGGLREETVYAFRFRAESEAGFGPYIVLTASTEIKEHTVEPSASASLTIFISTLSMIFSRILL